MPLEHIIEELNRMASKIKQAGSIPDNVSKADLDKYVAAASFNMKIKVHTY